MQGEISAQALLDVWERGAGYGITTRALWLLEAAVADASFEVLANWSIGRRDDALLTLREALFGERIEAVSACSNCGAPAQLEFRIANIRAPFAGNEVFIIEVVGATGETSQIALRAITTRDLLNTDRQDTLIRRCVLQAGTPGNVIIALESLPDEVLTACANALAAHDPQADVHLNLTCHDCGHAWDAPFDIATFLWREVDAWARRTLREVHLLASVYGWTESEILRLSARRRRQYLEMVVG